MLINIDLNTQKYQSSKHCEPAWLDNLKIVSVFDRGVLWIGGFSISHAQKIKIQEETFYIINCNQMDFTNVNGFRVFAWKKNCA